MTSYSSLAVVASVYVMSRACQHERRRKSCTPYLEDICHKAVLIGSVQLGCYQVKEASTVQTTLAFEENAARVGSRPSQRPLHCPVYHLQLSGR
jgi:hypothetical protein